MSSVPPPAVAMYQCGFCKAEYGRADHLVRHVRGHTKQRPFTCPLCGKSFARQDLLKRHVSTHSGEYGPGSSAEATMQAQLKQYSQSHRVHQACRSCAAKKLKCTDQKPCKRCRERGLDCDYEHTSVASPIQVHDGRQEAVPDLQRAEQSSMIIVAPPHIPPPPPPLDHTFDQDSDLDLLQSHADAEPNDHSTVDIQPPDSMSPQSDMMQDILGATLTLPDFGNFIEMDPDPLLDDIDFSFLNHNTVINMDQASPPHLPLSSVSETSPTSTTTGVGAEAYRRSQVHRGWEPATGENHELEHQNLILAHNVRTESFRASSGTWCAVKKPLSLSMRDRILAMILRTASAQATERTVASFPSAQVLGDLIHLALVRLQELPASSLIHLPSFDLDQQRPELLASLIAYGSISSPSPAVRKFGYAIQETVRIAINQLVEQQHATLREQDVCQAFYLQLYMAYYSGISRKIEMAEGISMLGATVLRRGKMLRAKQYLPPVEFLNLPGLSLHQKWVKWIDQESRKRLVYFAFTVDAHVSASRNINILFPYSELDTPLPTAQRLWEADSADKWYEILQHDLELQQQQPLSLSAILRRRPCLIPQHKSVADMTWTALGFFAGFWALVQEYQQMTTVLPLVNSFNDFVLNSRYSELSTILDQFRIELADFKDLRPEILIIQEFMGLHLNVAFYELSNYAGIGTEEEARQAVSYVEKWFESSQSRAALWHAGQIFRATRLVSMGSLTDIYVIALYHAAMTLWVWGILSRAQDIAPSVDLQRLALDGDESPAVSRFVKGSRMWPGLTGMTGQFLSLCDLPAAPDLANDIIMANWAMEPLPLTAEEVSRLMQGISRILRQRFKAVK